MTKIDTENLEPRFVDFVFLGKTYRLREASEAAYTAYQFAASRQFQFKLGDNGEVRHELVKTQYQDTSDSVLVQHCLFELQDKVEVPTSLDFVTGLPRRLTRQLLDWVKENSDMLPKGDKELPTPKAVTPDTTPTTG